MQWDQVRDEHVSTPSGHHVSVEQRRQSSPHNGAVLDCLDPEEECKHQQENCNGLVIVATGNRSGDITRGNAHESSREETSGGGGRHFAGQKIHGQSGQTGEPGCEQDAYVPDINGDCKKA